MASNLSDAASYVATEVAWNGSASTAWIQRKLSQAGYEVAATDVAQFGVQFGLLQPIPRLGGFIASSSVNAREFGDAFAEWMASA